MADFREELAGNKLKEAKSFAEANPKDPWGYKDKLDDIVAHYRSTKAGQEATKILADLKVPEKPEKPKPAEPKGAGAGKLILDPKSIETLNSQCRDAWRIENGVIVNIPGKDNAAQTATDAGDGEYKVLFEATAGATVTFSFRQSGNGTDAIHFNRTNLAPLENGKPHEFIYIARGDQVKATLDGKPVTMQTVNAPREGRVQFNVHDGDLKVHSIELRKLEN